ncbi:MAG: FtsX-like permease family protein [Myxococcota bacterium]
MAGGAPPSLIFRVAWRNVRRNWRHSLAALGTMAVGFVALALFQGYLGEFMSTQVELIYARNMIGEIMVRRPGAGSREARITPEPYLLDEKEQAFLEHWIAAHSAQVKTRVRSLAVHGMASTGRGAANFVALGHDVKEGRIARRHWAWNTWAGRPINDDETNGAVLGMALGAVLGCDPENGGDVPLDEKTGAPTAVERPMKCRQTTLQLNTTSASGRMNAMDAEVVGLTRANVREYDERLIWVPLDFARQLGETKGVGSYMLLLLDPSQEENLRAELSRDAEKAGLKLEIMDWKDSETAEELRRGMDLLAVIRSLMFVVIMVIAGVAVLTTMMKTVRERTREVGTLRSLGYRRGHVLAMFAVESVLLSLHAGVLGLVSAVGLTALINSTQITYRGGLLAESIPLRVGYSVPTYVMGFTFLALVAMLAAMAAARHVVKMSIATALSDS